MNTTQWGVTVLRVSLGLMFLAHGVLLKGMTYGLAGTTGFFTQIGLPAWLAPATLAAEAVGGLLLILGVQTRWVALALAPVLVGAIVTVHGSKGWVFTAPGGGWEYPAYLFVLCVAQALLGDGAYALNRSWWPTAVARPALVR